MITPFPFTYLFHLAPGHFVASSTYFAPSPFVPLASLRPPFPIATPSPSVRPYTTTIFTAYLALGRPRRISITTAINLYLRVNPQKFRGEGYRVSEAVGMSKFP